MEINPDKKKEVEIPLKPKEVTKLEEATNVWKDVWKDAWYEIRYTILVLISIGFLTLIGGIVFTKLEKAWGIYFWISLVGIATIIWQWSMTSIMFNIKEKTLLKLVSIVVLAIVEGHLAIFGTTAILKSYGINKEAYIPVFFCVMVLMAIPPILYIKSHAKKNPEDAKYAYEVIKPVVNSFALVCTIYIFTAKYFPNESANETMPGFFLNPKTLPFYCYPWTLAFTFAEYYIKKKYPKKKDETEEDEAT